MGLNVAVVGVGPVGERIVQCLEERGFPMTDELTVMATSTRKQQVAGRVIEVQKARAELFEGKDIVFFAGREGARGASKVWAPVAMEAGAYCIDNGSDFRLEPGVPLVVPEVNMDTVRPEHKLIASPNCSTIQVVMAIAPLHRVAGIKRMVVATYQSVSGWGERAMKELDRQLAQLVKGEPVEYDPEVFTRPIALDCIPHIDRFQANGYTKEEMKLVDETRKILDAPEMRITATAVRVPVQIGHAAAVNVEFERHLPASEVVPILQEAPGVEVIDGPTDDPMAREKRDAPEELRYPTQADVLREEYRDLVLVGRIRDDDTVEHGVNMWVVADNLRKGAALNVVQIAEQMIVRGFFGGKVPAEYRPPS